MEESIRLSSAFLHASKNDDNSFCPHEIWLEAMQEMDLKEIRTDGVYLNIGFNKGYNFANWMSLFVPWSTMTAKKWGESLLKVLDGKKEDICGFCNDCTSEFRKSINNGTARKGDHIFIGVDINKKNIDIVSRVLNCSNAEGLI